MSPNIGDGSSFVNQDITFFILYILHNIDVCVYSFIFYRFFKLVGLRACQYNISIMIRFKLELN